MGAPVSAITDVSEGRPSIRPFLLPVYGSLLCKLWENMASKWGFHPGGGGAAGVGEEEINCSLQQQEQQQVVGLPQIRSKLLVLGA